MLVQQTSFDFEIIVADDCSYDSTLAIIEDCRTGRHDIRIVPSERNVGVTRNYQRGFAPCRGEYIAVLEGDDASSSFRKTQMLNRSFLRRDLT